MVVMDESADYKYVTLSIKGESIKKIYIVEQGTPGNIVCAFSCREAAEKYCKYIHKHETIWTMITEYDIYDSVWCDDDWLEGYADNE